MSKPLDEGGTFSARFVVAAIATAIAVGGTASLGLARASDAHDKVEKVDARVHELDKRTQRVEDAVVTLKEIAAELKKRGDQ